MTDFTRRRLFRRGGIVAGLAAVAALAVVGSAAASAHSPTALHHASGPRPTIVLVHGAWANGSSWNGVVQRLQADGYTVDVPPNPLQGLAYDPAYLADFLHSISGPIVLVGHSYGGAVITNAATGDIQVKALVYVDAFAPDQGQTIGQLVSSVPGSCVVAADPTTLFNLATFPGRGGFRHYTGRNLNDAFGRHSPAPPTLRLCRSAGRDSISPPQQPAIPARRPRSAQDGTDNQPAAAATACRRQRPQRRQPPDVDHIRPQVADQLSQTHERPHIEPTFPGQALDVHAVLRQGLRPGGRPTQDTHARLDHGPWQAGRHQEQCFAAPP